MASFHFLWEFLRIFQLWNFFFLMDSGTRSYQKKCFESKNHPLIGISLFKNSFLELQSFRLQTTGSKESLIEFISAEKVAWDNLAVMASSHFLWEFLQIFQLFNFSFLMGSGTTSHQKNHFESKNHYLIPNSRWKNRIRNLGFFRLGGL